MTAQVEPQAPSYVGHPDTALRTQGALAGVFGAIVLAAFFLYLDTVRGRPLFTPTLLATGLLRGGEAIASPEALVPSLAMTVLFTAVHGLVFVAVGIGAAAILHRLGRIRHRGLAVLLVFTLLCLAFFAFALRVDAVGPQAVAVRDALVGNALAALAMGAYLARNVPRPDR